MTNLQFAKHISEKRHFWHKVYQLFCNWLSGLYKAQETSLRLYIEVKITAVEAFQVSFSKEIVLVLAISKMATYKPLFGVYRIT